MIIETPDSELGLAKNKSSKYKPLSNEVLNSYICISSNQSGKTTLSQLVAQVQRAEILAEAVEAYQRHQDTDHFIAMDKALSAYRGTTA